MQPEIDLFGLPVKTFGLMFALAFVACWAVVRRRLIEIDRPADWAFEIIFAAFVGGLIGSRIAWVLENWSAVSDDMPAALVSGSGLVWYGGVIGGTLTVLAWAWWRDWICPQAFDLAAVPLALGNAIGRVGCQLSGDGDYGKAWDGPWAMAYPNGTVPTAPGVTVHPTPIYETLAMGLIAWVLWRLRDSVRPGCLFALWLLLAGLERLLVEFVRINDEVALGLTMPQLQSLAMIVGGAVVLAVVRHRHGSVFIRPAPATATG